MSTSRTSTTRASSTDSSALSNIDVQAEAGTADDSLASTPPTSVDNRSMNSSRALEDAVHPQNNTATRRTKRPRSSVGSYNLKQLSDAQLPAVAGASRNPSGLSGRTLVDQKDRTDVDAASDDETDKGLKPGWEAPTKSPKRELPPRPTRKPSVTEQLKNGVKRAAGRVQSALGKRSRDMFESGKRTLGIQKEEDSPQKSKLLKELDMGKRGVLDELDLDADYDLPATRPAKRVKTTGKAVLQEIAQPATTGPLQKTSDGNKVKKWQNEGLYVGQEVEGQSGPKKLQKKQRPGSSAGEAKDVPAKKAPLMPLPMFAYLENSRDFIIPYDVFAPAFRKGDEKPKDWSQINRNRLVGEAKDLWEREAKLAQSSCVCSDPEEGEMGCDYDCLNRVMQYECNGDNCRLSASVCSNRPFAELAVRNKKGGPYNKGVEVIKTDKRGFGVRATRSFRPGQIIMEYTGEIISEGECQRRMREDYKDKKCYYLMELERNLVIDGTRGSMARFINHCCDPNSEVRMLKVNGTPRMAVFAGDSGIMTGEELTYDYNFDNFGETRQPCYCGAQNCRGYLGKRLNTTELKKQLKEDAERKRKAAEMAQKAAENEQRKKKAKTDRGPGWTGWVPVDDPEMKAKLREEKRLKEEAENSSSRAKRMAARRGSLPAAPAKSPAKSSLKSPARKFASLSRRKTVHVAIKPADDEEEDEEDVAAPKATKQLRRTSTGSRFTEDLDVEPRPVSRPGSRHSARSVFKKTTYSVKSSMEMPREEDEEATTAGAKEPADSAMDVDGEEERLVEEPKTGKRNSFLQSLGKVPPKWKQLPLSFGRKG